MIILVHENNKTVELLNSDLEKIEVSLSTHIATALIEVSKQFPETLVFWCHKIFVENINIAGLQSIFHHTRILASFNPFDINYLPNQIGYIDRDFFLNINKTVIYPTWLTSSIIGGVNTSVITSLKSQLNSDTSFDYFLNSLAKRAMVDGLFCYSEPKLLQDTSLVLPELVQASTSELFVFVKQHYKWVWVFFLAISYFIYEKKITLLPLLKSLFYKQLSTDLNIEALKVHSTKTLIDTKTIDVIIPTIGRKQYLYDVLKDLSEQTLLPENVIIVEQNPLPNSVSELNYLETEVWPFNIKHTFTNQSGVVNARNIALSKVTSEWVFFADDDIRFDKNLLEQSIFTAHRFGIFILNYLCLLPNQKQTFFKLQQTSIFGSGCSFVKNEALKSIVFNSAYEYGFGEDTDFGMQLRNHGYDVIFVPHIKITHLKAPIGGYRTQVKQRWADDVIQPKPSPTIQLLYQTYYTDKQLLGYKLLLGLRSYKHNNIKKPIAYIKHFNKQWKRSQFWSAKLLRNET